MPAPGQAPDAPGTPPTHGLTRVFSVPDDARPCRMDAFLGDALREDGLSREKIKQAILSGKVTRNGSVCRKPNTPLAPGDTVAAALPRAAAALEAEAGTLAVLWRDEHLAVLNKPAGLTVHPAPGLERGTLAHRLLHHFPELAEQGGLRPGIVHRLDKDTSGLLLVALTEKARLAMSEAFAERHVAKEYLALVHGVPEKPAAGIERPIGRSPAHKTKMAVLPRAEGGREAHSEYATLYADPAGKFSLVRVAIHTGRTHQIRVHMQHIGHPLVGDAVYAQPGLSRFPRAEPGRQMLHAWRLAFAHPLTGERLAFCAEPPEDFARVAGRLAEPMQRVVVTGSPGGGKSTLTNALREAGTPVWSADDAVRRLYGKGENGWYVLRRRYGHRFTPDDAAGVDKKALFAAMAASESLRLEVESLVHPLVRHDLETFWRAAEAGGAVAAAAEIPLYLESGWRAAPGNGTTRGDGALSELLIAVYCPFAKRRERMMATRGWDDATVAAMESWQWPERKKIQAADLVVDNSGDLEDMRRRAQGALNALAFLREHARLRISAAFRALWRCGNTARPAAKTARP